MTTATEETTAAREINELENARYRAMVSNDFAALEHLLADDLLYTHSSSVVDTKAQYIEALRSGALRYLSAERQLNTFRCYGDIALLQGRMKARIVSKGVERSLDNEFSCVWARKASGWQLVNFASTPRPRAAQ